MQKIVADRFRPDGKKDLYGVEQARFSMADCAAAPALFYANLAGGSVQGTSGGLACTRSFLRLGKRLRAGKCYRRIHS
jgi:hypothetical protein